MSYTRRDFGKAAISGLALAQASQGAQVASNSSGSAPKIKWSYMDHWSMRSARGWVAPQLAPKYADRFYKALVGVGFQAVDPFDFRLNALIQVFGSAKKVEQFAQDRGIERFVNVFGNSGVEMPHLPEAHDDAVRRFEAKLKLYEGIKLDTFIVMPGARYWLVEPVTDEKIKRMAECWTKVGRKTMEHGIKLTCHHEFYCSLHTR